MKITRTYLKAKNGLLLNVGIIALLAVGTFVWYLSSHARVQSEIRDIRELQEITDNVSEHGLLAITQEDMDDLSKTQLRSKKLQQLQKLFPDARSYVFSDDPQETITLQDVTLSLLEKPKDAKDAYYKWLTNSFTKEMEASLVDSQKELGEVIPVFVSLSPDEEDTGMIYGKVDLKNIVLLVQDAFFAAHDIPNVEGALGIRNVTFDETIGDLGYYEVVARVENIPSHDILELLQFIGGLGSIRIKDDDGGAPAILHDGGISDRVSRKAQYAVEGRSALSNPLVTIPGLIIEPGTDRLSDVTNSDIDPYITMSPRSRFRNWNMTLTMRFYVRGAAPEHIDVIRSQIETLIQGKTIKPLSVTQEYMDDDAAWSLMDRIENALLLDCGGCQESLALRQLRADIEAISDVYMTLQEEADLDETVTPTEKMENLMDILEAINNIEAKFESLLNKLK